MTAAWLRRRFAPAPDSAVADSLRCGKSPWVHAVHLLWSAWLFITPSFGGPGYTPTWFALTALSFPVFLALYAGSVLHSRRLATSHALGMVALCLALLATSDTDIGLVAYEMAMLVTRVGKFVASPSRSAELSPEEK